MEVENCVVCMTFLIPNSLNFLFFLSSSSYGNVCLMHMYVYTHTHTSN